MKALDELEVLERPYSLRLLIALKDQGPATITQISQRLQVKSRLGITNAVTSLARVGLIQEETSREFPFRRQITLTERGRQAATYVIELQKTLKEALNKG